MEQHDNFIVIDVQVIFVYNKIFTKEVCVSISDFEKQTFHIKSTTKYSEIYKNDRVTNKIYNHLHGLHWNIGKSAMKDLSVYKKKGGNKGCARNLCKQYNRN